MQDELVNTAIHITPGQLCVLAARPGQSLHILDGQVWLTEAGIPDDVILHAGDRYSLRGEGKLLIEAASSAYLQWHDTASTKNPEHTADKETAEEALPI